MSVSNLFFFAFTVNAIILQITLVTIRVSNDQRFLLLSTIDVIFDGFSYCRFLWRYDVPSIRFNRSTNWNLPASAKCQECRRDPVGIQELRRLR